MSDKELLELAAKAIGLEPDAEFAEINGLPAYWITEPQTHWWNPLTDDGDALRLAVKLNLAVQTLPGRDKPASEAWHNDKYARELWNGDPYAATRRAIVRAAAEIARQSTPTENT
jgi:hypothetical protein